MTVAHRAPTMDNSTNAEFDAGGVGRRKRAQRSVDAKEDHFILSVAPGMCEGPRVSRPSDIATPNISTNSVSLRCVITKGAGAQTLLKYSVKN